MKLKKDKSTVKSKKKIIYNSLIVIFVIVILISAYNIISYFWQSGQSNDTNNEIFNEVVIYDDNGSNASNDNNSSQSGELTFVKIPNSIDFQSLTAKNDDVVGWIFSQNGIINYPVLQGDDNDYYVNHLINGKKNANGSIFMDYKNQANFLDKNTVLYGHSMNNGSMFGTLLRYKRQSYYDNYPVMYLYTPNGNYILEIFSAFETTANDTIYNKKLTQKGQSELITYMFSKSKIKTDVSISENDNVVTLSTCAYSSKNARFVVCCKLVPIGF